MLAIEQSPAEARLLSPPAVPDIARALAATGSDALVYLLPGTAPTPASRSSCDQDGTVRWLPLAGLHTGGASPVSAFLRARRAVEAAGTEAATEAARQAWLPVLGTLCGWAWRAAIGPVLDAIPARTGKPKRRIVLVPVAELGVVPWHAARQPETGRYACQRVVFSYAASARQFVRRPGAAPAHGRRTQCSFPTRRHRRTSPRPASATCSPPGTPPQRCSGPRAVTCLARSRVPRPPPG